MKTFHEQYKNQVKQLADQMRNVPLPSLTEDLFALYETSGNRLIYEEVYFRRRKFLAVFGIAVYMFQRQEDVAKLEEVLQEICEEECWALPAHVNRKENLDWRISVDLFASETAQALAELVMLVNSELSAGCRLSEEICQRVRLEVERRVLIPFEASHQGWECSDHNWNAVCCGSIGSAALYLLAEGEEERLKRILQRICHSLGFYLEGFREDGACMEGIGYFTYGFTYFTGFAEQLLRYSKGNRNLFENDKVRKIAEFQQKMYFSNGQTVSFSDGESNARFRMGLSVCLARNYPTAKVLHPKFACDFETDSCYRFMGLLRDYLWTKETAETEKNERPMVSADKAEKQNGTIRHDVLPFAQWSICESKNGVGFAIKGGNNGEPHNHNDVGSFLYMAGNEQLVCDLGAGEYTAEYFSEGRYRILCNSAEGHSVPIINGVFQKEGIQYGASVFQADGMGKTKLEFAGAYPESIADKIVRETAFSLEDGSLTITDEFELPPNTECVTEQVVTRGTVEVLEKTEKEQRVKIFGKQVSCMLRISEDAKNLRVIEKIHSNHQGKSEVVRMIRWDVMIQEPKTTLGEKREKLYGISKYTVWCG